MLTIPGNERPPAVSLEKLSGRVFAVDHDPGVNDGSSLGSGPVESTLRPTRTGVTCSSAANPGKILKIERKRVPNFMSL